MNHLRQVIAVLMLLGAAACGDGGPPGQQNMGQIEILVMGEPADITAIRVSVTALDIVGDVHTDLHTDGQGAWSGVLLNVPTGTSRTVTANGFDINGAKIYTGATGNVAVFAGESTSVDVVLKPFPGPPDGVANTPPQITELDYADATESNTATQFTLRGLDPDDNALLTYTWSATPGGTFTDGDGDDVSVSMNHASNDPQTVIYTPPSDYTGFAVVQVGVSDGTATTTTSFPFAIGSA